MYCLNVKHCFYIPAVKRSVDQLVKYHVAKEKFPVVRLLN